MYTGTSRQLRGPPQVLLQKVLSQLWVSASVGCPWAILLGDILKEQVTGRTTGVKVYVVWVWESRLCSSPGWRRDMWKGHARMHSPGC